MGVTSLWHILEPVKQHVPLSHRKGKTLAVDLSLWVCEAQNVKKMVGVVTKPYLRNLFFRVSSLMLMGIRLVFVMEGDAPKLKADTMNKRSEVRFGASNKPGTTRTGRSHFRSFLKECLEMLECLGIPWVQAAGEAEAMCAYLNAEGYVDGCITNDGDAFLYGAQTVYRNFTMNVKDPHVDCYSVSSIEETLGCNRECLIGLAILLGCDYLPKGVPGVGKEQALKLIRTLRGQSLLQRFEQWKDPFQYSDIAVTPLKKVVHCTVCRHPGSFKHHEHVGCQLCKSVKFCKPHDMTYLCSCDWHFSKEDRQMRIVEDSIRKKAKACEGFPFPEVIQEYLLSKDKLVKPYECQRPNLLSFQSFASTKMDWPKPYACKKLCTLLTYYDMNRRKSGHTEPWQLQALRIIKTRIKNGIPCFEIEWQKPDHYATADDQPVEPFLITTEESSLFQAAYPEIVALYQMEKLEMCKKKGKKTSFKQKEDLAGDGKLADLLSQLTLQSSCEIFPDHNPKSDLQSKCQTLPKPESNSQKRCVSTSFSVEVLQRQNSPSTLLVNPSQNSGNECNSGGSLSSQVEFTNSCASSVIADLQLSSIDWEGTSFNVSPARVNDGCSSESEWCACNNSTGQCPLLHCKTIESTPLFSNSVQHDQDPHSSVDSSVSSSNLPDHPSTSSFGGLCIETTESTQFGNNPRILLPKPTTKVPDSCQRRENVSQMSVKNSVKSVCQSGYCSSEDSDEGDVRGERKAARVPRWQKKCSLIQLRDKCHVKRSNTESELEVKLKGKVSGTDLSVEQHPGPASVVHVYSSPRPKDISCHLQETGSEADVWVDSPLPLSERLKRRM